MCRCRRLQRHLSPAAALRPLLHLEHKSAQGGAVAHVRVAIGAVVKVRHVDQFRLPVASNLQHSVLCEVMHERPARPFAACTPAAESRAEGHTGHNHGARVPPRTSCWQLGRNAPAAGPAFDSWHTCTQHRCFTALAPPCLPPSLPPSPRHDSAGARALMLGPGCGWGASASPAPASGARALPWLPRTGGTAMLASYCAP